MVLSLYALLSALCRTFVELSKQNRKVKAKDGVVRNEQDRGSTHLHSAHQRQQERNVTLSMSTTNYAVVRACYKQKR